MTPRLRRRPGASSLRGGRWSTGRRCFSSWRAGSGPTGLHAPLPGDEPGVAWVVPWVHRDLVPLKGVLLWNETVLVAPGTGVVRYPLSAGPVKVARGAVVATVNGVAVRAPSQGIFLAAVDGRRDAGATPSSGRGRTSFPPRLGALVSGRPDPEGAGSPGEGGASTPGDPPAGIPGPGGDHPQGTGGPSSGHPKGPDDTGSMGEVRVYENLGARSKLYLGCPGSPGSGAEPGHRPAGGGRADGRGGGARDGPHTRQGHRGVFSVRGAQAVFQKVEGKPIGADGFW
jgi:hypothetical protein